MRIETPPKRENYTSLNRVPLGELYDDTEHHIVVDDVDLSGLDDWTHYYSWDFVPEVRKGNIVSELPPAEPLDELDEFLNPQIPGDY